MTKTHVVVLLAAVFIGCHKNDAASVAVEKGDDSSVSRVPDYANSECIFTSETARWRVACNWCSCLPSVQKAACSKVLCPEDYDVRHSGEKKCEGDAQWKEDCNWCVCGLEGQAVCTSNPCGIPPPVDVEIQEFQNDGVKKINDYSSDCRYTSEGARWRVSCNWCRCLQEPGKPACTRRGCPPDYDIRAAGQKECEGEAEWKRDCNWCHCRDGRAICTSAYCGEVPEYPQVVVVTGDDGRGDKVDDYTSACKVTSEGSRWRVSCNWCRCLESGKPACTRRGCPADYEIRAAGQKECEGDARWRRDCNWCHCVNDRAICTSAYCGQLPEYPKVEVVFTGDGPKKGKEASSVECKYTSEEDQWRVSCNWCRCLSDTQTAACTQLTCDPDFDQNAVGVQLCKGHAEWKDDCNWCHCVNGRVICTSAYCGQLPEYPKVEVVFTGDGPKKGKEPSSVECKYTSEEDQWRVSCNWCRCLSDTHTAACTQLSCDPDFDQNAVGVQLCKGHAEWKDDCNWCHCVDGRVICTSAYCGKYPEDPHIEVVHMTGPGEPLPPLTRTTTQRHIVFPTDDVCKEGVSWVEECNTCFCRNGKPLCTSKDCATESKNTIELDIFKATKGAIFQLAQKLTTFSTSECTEGSRWKKDGCNWCTCSNGKGLCTRKACKKTAIEERSESEPSCEDNSEWQEDCNFCHCSSGIPICTSLACLDPNEIKTAVEEPQKSVECVEGSQWKTDDCNWCSCSEGVGICTLVACIEDSSTDEPKCRGNSEWREITEDGSCSWCICNAGQSACRPSDCEVFQLTREEDCTPNSTWRNDGCNWCNCNEGVGVCTLKACIGEVKEPVCKGNSGWKQRGKDGCSWCRCENEVAICKPAPCHLSTSEGVLEEETEKEREVEISSNVVKEECRVGSRWRLDDCNWCTCTPDKGARCTFIGCISEAAPDAPECDGVSEWKTYHDNTCSWCVCSEGRSSCQPIQCQGDRPRSVVTKEEPTNIDCIPGSRFKDDDLCNWCGCANNGVAACTLMGCTGKPPVDDPECKDDSEFKRRHPDGTCSWCICKKEKAVCRQSACEVYQPKRKRQCTTGSSWRKECNWCSCVNGIASCTLMGCIGSLNTDEPACKGNSEWKQYSEDGCSWCTCDKEKAACTPVPCRRRTSVLEKLRKGQKARRLQLQKQEEPTITVDDVEVECTEGSRWRKDSCNWCSCSNSKGACTLKGCFSEAPPDAPDCEGSSEWLKKEGDSCSWCVCKEGKSSCLPLQCKGAPTPKSEVDCFPELGRWRVKCNWCTCTNGIGSCTKIGCLSEVKNKPECESDVEWRVVSDKGCSWCKCQEEKAVCEEIPCKGTATSLGDAPAIEKPCETGSSWTEGCNICMCANKVKVCTKKACLPEVTREAECKGQNWKKDCNTCQCISGRAACTRRVCPPIAPLCRLPVIKPGAKICAGSQVKWTYNADNHSCEKIDYGGCGGTENLFDSKSDCETACGDRTQKTYDKKDVCTLSTDSGPCYALTYRYAYVRETNQCQKFEYGGCLGNQNNFPTAEECQETCQGKSVS